MFYSISMVFNFLKKFFYDIDNYCIVERCRSIGDLWHTVCLGFCVSIAGLLLQFLECFTGVICVIFPPIHVKAILV